MTVEAERRNADRERIPSTQAVREERRAARFGKETEMRSAPC